MSVKILAVVNKDNSSFINDAMASIHLPISLQILETDSENLLMDIDVLNISSFDLVITSKSFIEIIKGNFHELLYIVAMYSLDYTESEAVQALVEAKRYGQRVILLDNQHVDFDFTKYLDLLDIDLVHLPSNKENEHLLKKHQSKGYNVVIAGFQDCKLAKSLGFNTVQITRSDSMSKEIIKAYQLAATRKKMMRYDKIKDAFFGQITKPIFLLNANGSIIDVNNAGLQLLNLRNDSEILGKEIKHFIDLPTFSDKKAHSIIRIKNINETTIPIMISSELDGYLVIIEHLNKNKHVEKETPEKTFVSKYEFKDIITNSPIMKRVVIKAKHYSRSQAPIFIYGESGTGKELVAHSIHMYNNKKEVPFFPVNCAAISQSLLESELFGYEKGAFTGANKEGKPGFFEMAQGGTIFLDEIGEISLEVQTRLLRVLQEKEVIRIGGTEIIPLNVRIITATNKFLPELIEKGLFREDLYYRINVLQLNVPSLRERKEDILLILKHLLLKHGMFLEQINYLFDIGQEDILTYDWPGNIRELENMVLRFMALISTSTTTYDLVTCFKEVVYEAINPTRIIKMDAFQNSSNTDDATLTEREKIIKLLNETNSKSLTANKLGISRTTLWRRMKYYNIH